LNSNLPAGSDVITTNWSYAQVSFYPDEKKHGWIKRVSPFVFTRVGRDRVQVGGWLNLDGPVRTPPGSS